MAYDKDSLTRLAGGSGHSLWHYTTTGGTPVVSLTYANSVTASAVDVVDGLTVTATDSD